MTNKVLGIKLHPKWEWQEVGGAYHKHVHVKYRYVCMYICTHMYVVLYAWKLNGNLSTNVKKSFIGSQNKILTRNLPRIH